jgi:hypothetical protein
MAVEDVAHEWYMSFRPLSINTLQQAKAELLATFQGHQSGAKTTRDLLNCVQQDDEPLSKYLESFIKLKAQVLNVPEATVITAAIEGLARGQCASHLSREQPATVKELFEVMRKYARSEDDLKRRKAARSSLRQSSPKPPPASTQRNATPFRSINNLQEDSAQSAPDINQGNTPQLAILLYH